MKDSAFKTSPRLGHEDADAPLVPVGVIALRATTRHDITLYRLFSLVRGERQIILVVSVRRASRPPLGQPDYLRRWIEEVAKVEAPGPSQQ